MGKLNAAKQYMTGLQGLRQMTFSLLDMAWYSTQPAKIGDDVVAFEDSIMREWALFPRLAGPASTSFGHIFGGGYAAGYYSYLWAQVLDNDAFEAFTESKGGAFDPATAKKLVKECLSVGNTVDPAEAYRNFRGRDAKVDAFLKERGFN